MSGVWVVRLAVVLVMALVAASCGGDSDSVAPETTMASTADTVDGGTTVADGTDATDPVDTTDATAMTDTTVAAPEFAGSIDIAPENPGRCEVVGETCLLPFPSNALTVADSTPTGRRLAIDSASMPTNQEGVPVSMDRQNRADGFSPGSAALVSIAGLDAEASGLPPVVDIAKSLEDSSASVVVDATTGERWAHWAELDANALEGEVPSLFIRPAQNYANGHRIVIGLRNLVDVDGNPIEPTESFVAYRDRLETTVQEIEDRRPSMEAVFADLEAAGVVRSELTIAWDFTVVSTESMTAPLLEMRDNAFAVLGDEAPAFEVTSVEDDVDGGRVIIEGTYEVPLYLTGDGTAGNGLNLIGDSHLPEVNGTWTAPFRCQITDATTPDDPGPGVIYMHGLLGTASQATSSGPTALARRNFVPCGTDLIGMAADDVANAVASLLDASNFSTFADRLLQGHLNHLFLGRLMVHDDGFASHEAFQRDGSSLLDTSALSLYGISQGGIMGPVSTAISPDWDRAVLGVPGINYSTLLNRSIDFDTYQAFLDPAYPDKGDQAIVLLAMQLLWDQGEGNGWANYFVEPLPGMNPKTALLHVARGDQQVANVAADVMARTMDASIHWPAVADGRSTDVDPFWDIERIESYPFEGSATVMWDSGAELSPTTNTAPRAGFDPHSDPRVEPAAVDQIEEFLRTGTIIDTCNGQPCTAER